MSERRFESDMTKKEKRQMNWKRLKSLHGKAKREHIWAYYKVPLFGILAAIIILLFGINWIQTLRYDQILYVGVLNNTSADAESLSRDFKAFIGNDNKFDKVDFDTSLSIESQSEAQDTSGQIRFDVYTATALYDAVLVDEINFNKYKELDTFQPVAGILNEENEDYAPLITDGKGLKLEDNAVLNAYGIETQEPLYLMVGSKTKQEENVNALIAFLMEKEKKE